eukprot:3308410-Rhodomonas_salina.2
MTTARIIGITLGATRFWSVLSTACQIPGSSGKVTHHHRQPKRNLSSASEVNKGQTGQFASRTIAPSAKADSRR